ncbi:hypothetical protein BABINDRAFT_42055 [Babjeviella inositovora NRRL Y-12698]|uniref:Glycine cleavage system H protein n=1 Tax=Babjeviella inositovora NRRL Y-12698 TaxID=984486 RepID=A0A1E3QHJ2_9ASCO|nr:uncharacterized protein BABINDRAFT_42055 [Babjeviella inositovora NRRL Y-12698]ODQ77161.1 hypothetical protein BABINDRAFT_42055 [Babjeviella inositovora NRRL Y-12698]
MLSIFARSAVRAPVRIQASAVFSRFQSTLNQINKDSVVGQFSAQLSVKYTAEHEWLASAPDGTTYVGITKYAADALGDATFIELPTVGDVVEIGDSIGSVESVKSASEVYAPISGEVLAVNEELEANPQLINEDPMGNGWFVKIKVADVKELETNEELLSEAQYQESLSEEDH